MAKITYTDKVSVQVDPTIPDINKVTDADMNEIKDVVNDNYDYSIYIGDEADATSDTKLLIDTDTLASLGTEITNTYSTSETMGYSANYVNNLNTYSTTEQRIGTWIDGKPLYRRVITGTTPNSTTDSVIGNIGTDKKVVKIDGYINGGSTYQILPINFYFSDEYSIATYVTTNNGNIHMKLNSVNYQSKYTEIVVEYTKTTD
jgi:hypothetical protein